MAKKKVDLRQLSLEELQEQLTGLQVEMQRLRFNHATGILADTNVLSETRKNVARVHTELRRRELESA